MRYKLIIILTLIFAKQSYCQQLTFVKDSIMDNYMESGYSNKHFNPKGKEDKNKLRQGYWKDYEAVKDFEYLTINEKPKQMFGYFLIYGEGEFIDGKREGNWKFYVIEDKTFKKILQKELNYKNGKREGAFKYYYPSGKIGIEGAYASDTIEGVAKSYYENGDLYGTRYYKNGLRTGKHIYLFHNGKVFFEQFFLNDTLNGLFQSFYPNGKIEEIFNYKMGKEDGTYKYYYDNGQLWIEEYFNDGLLMNVVGSYSQTGELSNCYEIMFT